MVLFLISNRYLKREFFGLKKSYREWTTDDELWKKVSLEKYPRRARNSLLDTLVSTFSYFLQLPSLEMPMKKRKFDAAPWYYKTRPAWYQFV